MTEALNNPDPPAAEASDETTPRGSAPAAADFQGQQDPEAELVLQALVAAGTSGGTE
jgi:hypothetical protein